MWELSTAIQVSEDAVTYLMDLPHLDVTASAQSKFTENV